MTLQREKPVRKSRVRTVLRVSRGERYLGDILLDGGDRVWRRADTIPADVVLKALLAYSRSGEVCGEVVGRRDGRAYTWYILGAVDGAEASGELLEAA